MQIAFEGWQRNHGMKVMLSKSLKDTPVVDDWSLLKKEEIKIKRLSPESDSNHGVQISFYTDMRLGGAQMGVLTLSRRELVLLLKGCANGLTLEKFVEFFNEA